MHNPLHAAGLLLDPEFVQHDYSDNEEVQTGMREVLAKVFPNQEERGAVMNQLAHFRSRSGVFRQTRDNMTMWIWARQTPAWMWWQTYCNFPECKQLRYLAMRVLAQPSSACSCERNWSTYDFIHNKLRNRLSRAHADQLVFIFSNMQLIRSQKRMVGSEHDDSTIPWQWYDSDEDEGEAVEEAEVEAIQAAQQEIVVID